MSNNNNNNNKRSRLDRSIVIIIDNADETPSRKLGMSVRDERIYRMYGVSLIDDTCQKLKKLSLLPIACTMFHRYYHQMSFTIKDDVWSITMACILLAAKIEEIILPVKDIILTYVHMYRSRCSLSSLNNNDNETIINIQNHPLVSSVKKKSGWLDEKESTIISQFGPVWKEWHDAIVQAEAKILRQLGFVIYWIPQHQPHKYVHYFIQLLDVDESIQHELEQAAWKICNISYRLDICVRYTYEIIACAAIQIASYQHKIMFPKHWWYNLCAEHDDVIMSTIMNAILGLQDTTNIDIQIATKAFIKSAVSAINNNGNNEISSSNTNNHSFNDPGSFLWDCMIEENE